jgi:uncharacterized protein (TIGR02246 family)
MRNQPPPLATADTPDDVESAFYEALQRGDIEALMALWADDDEIVCVHPGGGRVIGTAAIRASFEAIFASGGIPVQVEQVHRLDHIHSALHHLVERVAVQGPQGEQTAWVLATNWYVKTPQGWRLASHHASPGSLHPQRAGTASPLGDGPGTLH